MIEKLPEMSRQQLLELHTRAAFLLGQSAETAPKANDKDLQTVCAAMNHAMGANIPLAVLLKSNAGSSFKRGAITMLEFARNELKAKTRMDEIRALRLLFRYILKDLAEAFNGPIPATPRTLSARMERVAETVDKHFPAYRAAGLLPVLLQGGRSSD